MDERAPPPSYDDVLKGSGMSGPTAPPEAFPQAQPGTMPYPPAGYGQGMPPAQSAYPPPVQGVSGTQPPSGSSFPQYTYSTVNAGFPPSGGYPYSTAHAGLVTPGSGQPYQQPSNQVGNTTVTSYQQPIVVPSATFQMSAPANRNQQVTKGLCLCIFAFLFVFGSIVLGVIIFIIIQ